MGSSIVCICVYCLPHQYSLTLSANCAFRISVRTYGHRGVALTLYLSLIIIVGWILGKPLTLLFDPFESIVLFLSGETPTCFVVPANSGFLVSFDCQHCRARWQIKLAKGYDPHMYV